MNRRALVPAAMVIILGLSPLPAQSQGQQTQGRQPLDQAAVERLRAEAGEASRVSIHPATGAVRFVRLASSPTWLAQATTFAQRHEQSMAFLRRHAGAFGLSGGGPDVLLRVEGEAVDSQGGAHLTYSQAYGGVRVFAGILKTHFDAAGNLTAVNGTVIPDITVDSRPSVSSESAAGTALATVTEIAATSSVAVTGVRLYVFRTGLAAGVEGQNRLAWEVEVGDGAAVRQLVYVDAHTGKVIDRIDQVQDALVRRVYDTEANFPNTPFWVEGDAFPTGNSEADNVIQFSGETYDFYLDTFGRDSFDAAGGIMHGVFNRTANCPNASWNGTYTSYCTGIATDDVVGHEWTHAYTEFTHGLIYQWQPGALNEWSSDIFGEIVDLLNGTGLDSPGGPRTDGTCSEFTGFPPVVVVNTPASIAGVYPAGAAEFGPPLTAAGLTGDVVLVNDGVGAGTPPAQSTTDGCETPFVNAAAVAGKIALVDRGTCNFTLKVKNAQLNGAIGVIVANHQTGGNGVITMSGVDPTITIPSASVGFSNGNKIKSELASGVNATLRVDAPSTTDNSYRWLISEDSTGFGGAIRDMWTPTCYNHPGKVSDTQYVCTTGDAGGVHSNSGVPNHGFALLVDGGTYNGQTIGSLGPVKAAHLYFRAMTLYQNPASDFADHADALEQSCSDLLGISLTGFDGGESGEAITVPDCSQVSKMIAAVELRMPPTQCNFQPLLAKNPPERCEVGSTQLDIFQDIFEIPPDGWMLSHTAVSATFTPRDWEWVNTLPDRAGSAFFGIDPNIGACSATDDQSGVLHLDSPVVSVPNDVVAPRLTFDHWVSTETDFDGGNLQVSTNGGPWQLVQPGDFTFNSYNTTLATVAAGNTNPLAGQPAFSGTDGGVVTGSWGRSHVNLAPYVGAGQSFRLRWNLGTDGWGLYGWYVDDVTVYSCSSSSGVPIVSINDVAVAEGDQGQTDAVFTVSLSNASNEPVKVKYKVMPGTAQPTTDYLTVGTPRSGGEVVISPLTTTAEIKVQIVGNTRKEPDETYFVVLEKPEGATIGDGTGNGTIVNDDGP